MKVPLLPRLAHEGEEGWSSTIDSRYSSLIGLPLPVPSTISMVFFRIETSYLYSDCLVTKRDKHGSRLNSTGCNNGVGRGMVVVLDADSKYNVSDPSTAPRRIWFEGLGGSLIAECSVTTTYVEIKCICKKGSCTSAAIRRSRLPHRSTTITWLDGLASDGGSHHMDVDSFCSGFVNAADLGAVNAYRDSGIERFLTSYENPFTYVNGSLGPTDFENIKDADLSNLVFSQMFTQLLNTYWLASIAPLSTLDGLEIPYRGHGHGFVSTTTSEWQSPRRVLDYNTTWLVVLTAGSLVMLAAGIATVILNLMRRGPEVLDSFTSMLRENQYAQEETGPSTEDASEKVRRLRKARVMLGDVHPLEMTGHVAVTTRIDGDSVQPLRSGRLYY
jgi:hypothetical protein